jgi:presenilin enhancer 2
MDLSRVPNKRKLELCLWYFKGKIFYESFLVISSYFRPTLFMVLNINFISVGFALLPFAWTVNVFWFFEDAFLKPTFEEQKSIKKCE